MIRAETVFQTGPTNVPNSVLERFFFTLAKGYSLQKLHWWITRSFFSNNREMFDIAPRVIAKHEAFLCVLHVHTTWTCGITDVTYGTEVSMLWWECTVRVGYRWQKNITQRPLLTAVLFHETALWSTPDDLMCRMCCRSNESLLKVTELTHITTRIKVNIWFFCNIAFNILKIMVCKGNYLGVLHQGPAV